MSVTPAVTVLISTYDRPGFLGRALGSVAAQTYRDFEVMVVDDCSPDTEAMQDVLGIWHRHFDSIGIPFTAIRLGQNSGYQAVPKNIGIQHSNGDFIAYLDDDNVWLPRHLEALMETILRLDVDMVYGGRRYINDRVGLPTTEGDWVARPYDLGEIEAKNHIDTSDILHSKGAAYELLRRTGTCWDEDLRRFGDWNLVWRWGKAGLTAAPVDEILTEYHWHGGNLQLTRKPVEVPLSITPQEWERIRVQ